MPAHADTVTGTLTWPEPTGLPPAAVLEVTVEDISRADAPSTRLAGFTLSPVGAPPIAFSLEVPTPDPRARLTVRATVRAGDALLLTTDTIAPVLTQGAGTQADLALIHVGAPSPAALTGIDWRITSLGSAPVPTGGRDPVLNFKTTA
jgi:putative lipoprotein